MTLYKYTELIIRITFNDIRNEMLKQVQHDFGIE